MTECVRCNEEFEQAAHPMAHFFSICPECREQSPETIMDQQRYNFNLHILFGKYS
jgi:hypothetical protein